MNSNISQGNKEPFLCGREEYLPLIENQSKVVWSINNEKKEGISMKTLEDIFDETPHKAIFKNVSVLRESYIPDKFPHREKQQEEILQILKVIKEGRLPENMIIWGGSGTGKTAIVKHITNFLLQKLGGKFSDSLKKTDDIYKGEMEQKLLGVYVNCNITNTYYRVLTEICNTMGAKLPFTGLATDAVFKVLRKLIEESGIENLIFILDEIDELVRNDKTSLYGLARINEMLKNPTVTLIGICNDIGIIDDMNQKITSSLGFIEISFPNYTILELGDILRIRAKMAINNGGISEGAIPYLAAKGSQSHSGNVRILLTLLRKAGSIAENEANIITRELLEKAEKKNQREEVARILMNISSQPRNVLEAICDLDKKNKRITMGKIYKKYRGICNSSSMKELTSRQVFNILEELERNGIIGRMKVCGGRRGITSSVELRIERYILESILEERLKEQNIDSSN